MFPTPFRIVAIAALLLLSACGGRGQAAKGSEDSAEAAAGYLAAPVATTYTGGALAGRGAPGARVRLASPTGEAVFAQVDGEGRWSLRPPAAAEPRIWGLSMTASGRQVQSEGYVLVAPAGAAAVLRAGGGSRRLDPQPHGIGVVDFDRGGGAVVSGTAPPDAVVVVRLDGRQVAEGRADESGRFAIALPPTGGAAHRLQVFGDGLQDEARVETAPAPPLVGGPLRSQLSSGGLRADWLTPGGGVQSTVLID
ncbi:Ig-like domain-containing protein [Phenylobacterium sp.]|uniref:Ig-like domain-containing protein n=1 Tax=Phenylobacterium sp. TaxID=1871053 RepID=UPI0035B250F6